MSISVKTKCITMFIFVALISIPISGVFAYEISPIETRKDALTQTIVESQRNTGAFPVLIDGESSVGGTVEALLILQMLDRDAIYEDAAKQYLLSNFDSIDRLWLDYEVVLHSQMLGLSLNNSKIIERVLTRYENGSFHEFNDQTSGFPIQFHSEIHAKAAYAIPNVIDVWLGLAILTKLNVTEEIDKGAILIFINACRADNGGYKPFPQSTNSVNNPYAVDDYGAGLPYTFCAISTLNLLNRSLAEEDCEQTRDYVLSCQNLGDNFRIHQGQTTYTSVFYDYCAIKTLHLLNIENEPEVQRAVKSCVSYNLGRQQLGFNGWPIAEKGYNIKDRKLYGLFGGRGSISETYTVVMLLDATNSLFRLNEPSYRNTATTINLWILSYLASVLIGVVIIAVSISYDALQKQTRR